MRNPHIIQHLRIHTASAIFESMNMIISAVVFQLYCRMNLEIKLRREFM